MVPGDSKSKHETNNGHTEQDKQTESANFESDFNLLATEMEVVSGVRAGHRPGIGVATGSTFVGRKFG